MAEAGVAEHSSLEPMLLAVIATGAPLVGGPTALQVLWLIAVGAAGFMGRSRLREQLSPNHWS